VTSTHGRATARQAYFSGLGFSANLAAGRRAAHRRVRSRSKACSLRPPASTEQRRNALNSKTLGPGPRPVLKQFLNVNSLGMWTASAAATHGTTQSWSHFYDDTLFPPLMPSAVDDGIDSQPSACRQGTVRRPDRRALGLRGIKSIMPDSRCVDFTQGSPTGAIRPGQSVSMVFDLMIAVLPQCWRQDEGVEVTSQESIVQR
jgi:hypothetical protein